MKPGISVIIPAYNEEKRLPECIRSINGQDYEGEIDLLVVDDDSTDRTAEIAAGFGARTVRNGSHNIEIGKSIGLRNAKHEFILLLDADNTLPGKDWLSKSMRALQENPDAVGAQAAWFEYSKSHPAADRYCELFGINDPVAYYLGKRDRLMQTEKRWLLPGKITKECGDYYIIQFDESNLPTIGSQGFLTRKSLLLKTHHKPYLFHIDSNMELVEKGHDKYAIMKLGVVHHHCATLSQFMRKLHRNLNLFLVNKDIKRYKYNTSPVKLFFVVLSMVTLAVPAYHSIKGYLAQKDPAWFLHPILSFYVPIMYSWITSKWMLKNALGMAERPREEDAG